MIIDTQLASHEHIVRTTQQWESSAVKYKIIPRGCLCVELTPDGKTRVKIGEGNKYYGQLPYVDADIDMEEITHIVEEYLQYYATKEYVDTKIDVVDNKVHELDEQVTVLEETVGGYDERITTTENKVSELNSTVTYIDGRVTNVENTVSTYDDQIDSLEEKAHTHTNKSTLDQITAPYTTAEKDKLSGIEDHANNYSLPIASDTTIGGVKVGENLSIDPITGVLSADPSGYTLPPATDSTLGGIIVGNNLNITPEGVLSATGGGTPYILPIASDTTLGGIKVGENLAIDSTTGALDAIDTVYTLPSATDQTLGGIMVGDRLTIDSNGVLSADNQSYTLPKASDTTLGGIKVGNNLTIDSETGVLSADNQSITVDDELDDTSENPVQNKVLTPVLESLSTMITKISKQKVDLWWDMEDNGSGVVIGNAVVVVEGVVTPTPEIGSAETVTE